MKTRSLFALMGVIALVVGATGAAAAQPGDGEGPPDELPGVVPDFVSNVLDGIGSFVASVLDGVGGLVERVTPGSTTVDPGVPT